MPIHSKSRRQSALLLLSFGSSISADAKVLAQTLSEQASVLTELLPKGWQVYNALRHGQPTIEHTLTHLDSSVEELVVLPTYPQYSWATSGSIMSEVYRVLGEILKPIDLSTRHAWHNDSGYINAQARLIASFTSSRELLPRDYQIVFLAHAAKLEDGSADSLYEQQVAETADLVLERLGWPRDCSSLLHGDWGARGDVEGNDLSRRLRCLADEGVRRVVLFPLTSPLDIDVGTELANEGRLEQFKVRGGDVVVGPALGSYAPLSSVLKNIALRGSQPVIAGMGKTIPLLAPERVVERVESSPRSLVMIGASVAGKVRGEHGPDVVHSPARVFGEVKKTRTELRGFLDWVREETAVAEAFVWSTCQRIEFFGWLSESDVPADSDWPVARIRQHLYGAEPEGLKVNVLFGVEAWHHLLRTACGLNSALPGDTDVMDQLQTSFRMAERVGAAGTRALDLVENAVAVAQEVRAETDWSRFSRGYCAAALSRIHDLSGADLERCRHVVIGGSATSRSVLFTLSERFRVLHRQMTLIYRDHHGQMKPLRNAIGNGVRLRVHSYSEESVIRAIADADFVFFGIDYAKPVLTGEMLAGSRDFSARPLVIVDFNDSGSVSELERVRGITVWNAADLDLAVESYAEVMCSDSRFPHALEQVENWIETRLPSAEDDDKQHS